MDFKIDAMYAWRLSHGPHILTCNFYADDLKISKRCYLNLS